jgi:hypothetical protein
LLTGFGGVRVASVMDAAVVPGMPVKAMPWAGGVFTCWTPEAG